MLDQAVHTLDGTSIVATGDVVDIGRRLREGDPTCGWPGDPSMGLFVDMEEQVTDAEGRPVWPPMANPYFGWFEVWGIDAHREPYMIGRYPTCTQEILKRMAERHWSRGNAADRVIAEAQRRDAEAREERRERNEEMLDRMHFGLMRDNGSHYGSGLTRRIH